MGKHLQHSRSNPAHVLDGTAVSPFAIRYPFVKRVAVVTDIRAGIKWREVAKRHGVSQSTIKTFIDDPDVQAVIDPELVKARRESMANLYDLRAEQSLENITEEKLKNSSAAALMIIAGTATDKSILIRSAQMQSVGIVDAVGTVLREAEAIQKTRRTLELAIIAASEPGISALPSAPPPTGIDYIPQESANVG